VDYTTGTTVRSGTLLVETPALDLIARAGTTTTQDQVDPSVVTPHATPTPTPTPTATPTATPSPSPTPTPTPGECASSVPNTPDGPDPWGGCFPGPSNTGVPDGTQLTTYTGPCRITAAGTVIDAKTVNCDIDIATSGVVIRNSRVNGQVLSEDSTDSVTVTDTTIDAGPVDATFNNGPRALMDRNFVATRIETVRGISGGFCAYSCTLQDSWVHGQDPDEGGHAHESGFRQGSSTSFRGQKFIHNSIRCDAPAIAPDAGCSADMTGYGDFDTIQNNYVTHNLLRDTPEGSYCAYGGNTASKPWPNGNHNEWVENVFQRGSNGRCGYYGAMADYTVGFNGNVFTGNTWDDGAALLAPDG
jgi:hypothetical protein